MPRLGRISLGIIVTSWFACTVDNRLPTTVGMLRGTAGSDGDQMASNDPDAGSLSADIDMLDGPNMGGSDASTPLTPASDDLQMDAGSVDAGPGDSGGASVPPAKDALCSGCVELVVPVTGPLQQAQFTFAFNPPVDFTRGRVTWRIQLDPEDANEGFFLETYAISGLAAQAARGVFTNLMTLDTQTFPPGEWVEVTLDLAPYALNDAGSSLVDNRRIERVGLLVGASSSNSAPGNVRIYVDSVGFVGATALMTVGFVSSSEGLILDQYMAPTGTPQPIHHL